MSLINESKEHLVGVVNDLFQHLEQVDNATEVTLRQRTQEVEKLKRENEKLREELENASTRRWKADYEELEKKYDRVLRDSERLKLVNKDLYTRLSQTQGKLREWNRLSSPRPVSSSKVPPGSFNVVETNGNDTHRHVPERRSTPDLPIALSGGRENVDPRPSGLTNAVRRSSAERTEPHRKPQTPRILDLAGSDSSDLSTQVVQAIVNSGQKRKRGETQAPDLPTNDPSRESGHASDPVTVKSEPNSSNDDRHGKLEELPSSSNPEDLSRSLRAPTPKRPKSLNDDIEPDLGNTGFKPTWNERKNSRMMERIEQSRPSAESTPTNTPRTALNIPRIWHNPTIAPSRPLPSVTSRASPRPQTNRTPLQQLDQNAKVLPRTSEPSDTLPRKRRSAADAVHHLAEDGEEMLHKLNSPMLEPPKAGDTLAPGDHVGAYRRLDQLLSMPSPGRAALPQQTDNDELLKHCSSSGNSESVTEIPDHVAGAAATSRTRHIEEAFLDCVSALDRAFSMMRQDEVEDARDMLGNTKARSAEWFDKIEAVLKKYGFTMPERPSAFQGSRKTPTRYPNANSSRTKTPPTQIRQITTSIPTLDEKRNASTPHSHPPTSPTPDDEPLRARPLHRLTLEDFKINPTRNDGLTYAYSDVVRHRAARKCLPGCTRPECCGTKFRALAADLPASDDDNLLRDYLGPSLSTPSQLAYLTDTERSDLILQARTKMVADKYGKQHRHQWQPQRPKSPPGFWRTDFPATQEAEEDRREAEQVVREMVEGRWREAMTENGRWKFRDE